MGAGIQREEQLTRGVVGLLSAAIIGTVAILILRSPAPNSSDPAQSLLPVINAFLNGSSAVLLSFGFYFIRRRRIAAHRFCMSIAVVLSGMFLVTYVVHHYQVGTVKFLGPSWLKTIYLSVLAPHVILAAVMVPMVLTTLAHAWRGRFARHRRIARWTLPIWLYVSVSGVVVYWLLYHLGR
ncbi:MAG: DUF420 domain-containing protein [Deltaproteobacteria bacterium]|nr:DUF420 domain-containing protein [Deltaproteobacteria bacterium]